MAVHTLFSAESSTGDSTVFNWQGGLGTILITGTIGTYAATAQISTDGTNFVTMKDLNGNAIAFSGENVTNFYAPSNATIKVNNGTMTSTTVTGSLFDDRV